MKHASAATPDGGTSNAVRRGLAFRRVTSTERRFGARNRSWQSNHADGRHIGCSAIHRVRK